MSLDPGVGEDNLRDRKLMRGTKVMQCTAARRRYAVLRLCDVAVGTCGC